MNNLLNCEMKELGESLVTEFARSVHAQLYGHILPFWTGPALDREQDEWLPWMSNDLLPDRSQPKGLIVNSRLLWTFSAVQRRQPSPIYLQMATRAFDIVMNQFWDRQFGGAFWHLDGNGKVLDDAKKIYGQAFYIYALSEYHLAFDSQTALARAKETFELIERHAHDAKFGGYFEVRRRDWSEAGPGARLSDKDMNEKKSMNNHLHILEAYTNLYRVWKDSRLERRLRELIEIFESKILNVPTRHFQHFFDEQWRVRSDTYTFGHDIEGSWLLCEAAEVLGDGALLSRIRSLALQIAERVRTEGLDSSGGLCYEGKSGRVVDSGKEWWPQAEAVVGFLNAFQHSGDETFLKNARDVWNYIELHLVDRVHGEWFWRITENGEPDAKLPKVSEWKDPYHGVRACLETLRRLAEIQCKAKKF